MKEMKWLLISFFLVIGNILYAQNQDTVWTKTLGSTGNENALLLGVEWSNPVIGKDSLDNLYVLGRSNTANGDIHRSIGGEDCWIIKLNANGDTLWTKVFGGISDDIPTDILVLQNGDFIIAGYTFSNDVDLIGHHGLTDEDGFVARFDSNGNTLWAKQYGGSDFLGIPGHDIIKGITLLSNGNLLAVGNTNSNNGDLPVDLTKFGAAWILRVDTSNGNLINTLKVVGPNHDEWTPNLFISVSELPDGTGYFVLGETRYGIQPYRMWLVKFDNNDNPLWNKEFGSITDNSARCVIAMPNGGAMIAGNIGFADGDVSSWFGGFYDLWVALVDSNQNIINEKTFGGTQGAEVIYDLQKIDNNSYIFGASALSTDNYLHQNLGSADFWLVNINSNLDTNWTYNFGGSNVDQITGIIPDNNGNIYVVGKTESNDFYVHGNHGGRDIFLSKIQNAFPIGVQKYIENKRTMIYPNPANNQLFLTINNKDNKNIKISIFNSIGQNIKEVLPKKENVIDVKIDISGLITGIYFVKIQIGNQIETKIIIIKK